MAKASKHPNKQVWYIRRDREVRGPFPAGMVTRHILLGRILETDELSADQRHWEPVSALPELIPEEMKLDLTLPENQEKLKIAIMREDERGAGDRRRHGSAQAPETKLTPRRAEERREQESAETVQHRQIRSAITESLKPQTQGYRSGLIVLVFVIGIIIWAAIAVTGNRHDPIINVKCQSLAVPKVDWSHCHKNGVNLSDANLAGAVLNYISLERANLQRGTLVGVSMEHAQVSKANAQYLNLQHANVKHSVFHDANLQNADMRNADLSFAVFYNADLRGAKFAGANLTHVVLNNAKLDGADFSNAILDQAIWNDNSVCAPESIGSCVPVQSQH